jgi:hypothetical protein
MKKICFLSILWVLFVAGAYAQASISVGLGAEVNGYSTKMMAIGLGGGMDYRFNEMFSLGARGLYSLDIGQKKVGDVSVMEVTCNLRWYFLRFPRLLYYYYLWQNKYHFFTQFDLGGAFTYTKDGNTKAESGVIVGACAGVRIVFDRAYIEPYLRFSSTSMLGGGIMFGLVSSPANEGEQ